MTATLSYLVILDESFQKYSSHVMKMYILHDHLTYSFYCIQIAMRYGYLLPVRQLCFADHDKKILKTYLCILLAWIRKSLGLKKQWLPIWNKNLKNAKTGWIDMIFLAKLWFQYSKCHKQYLCPFNWCICINVFQVNVKNLSSNSIDLHLPIPT